MEKQGASRFAFTWSETHKDRNIGVYDDGYFARGSNRNADEWFPTIYSNRVIRPGAKILVDFKVHGGYAKIGVSTGNEMTSECFSDSTEGWSYYAI